MWDKVVASGERCSELKSKGGRVGHRERDWEVCVPLE